MTGKLSENGNKMINDQAVIRATSPPGRDTAKWLARIMGIPVRTARFWAEQTVPVYRREDCGLKLLEDFQRKRKWEDEVLYPALLRMAGLVNDIEIVPSSGVTSIAADLVGSAASRIEAAINWIETD